MMVILINAPNKHKNSQVTLMYKYHYNMSTDAAAATARPNTLGTNLPTPLLVVVLTAARIISGVYGADFSTVVPFQQYCVKHCWHA
jgi:hypothetical protein